MQRRDYGSAPSGLMSKRAERALREQQLQRQLQPMLSHSAAADESSLIQPDGNVLEEAHGPEPSASMLDVQQSQQGADLPYTIQLQESGMRQQTEAMAPRKRRRLSPALPDMTVRSAAIGRAELAWGTDAASCPTDSYADGDDVSMDMPADALNDSASDDWGLDLPMSPAHESNASAGMPQPDALAQQTSPAEQECQGLRSGLQPASAAAKSVPVYPWGRGDSSVVLHCDVNCYYCQVDCPVFAL